MSINPRRAPFAATALVTITSVCLLAAGCSASKAAAGNHASTSTAPSVVGGSAPSRTSAIAATTITIKNFGYTVSGAAVEGSTVKVTNNDAETHTVTADNGKAFNVTVQPGKTATFTAPTAAGGYKFHCSYHSNMHGTLTVSK